MPSRRSDRRVALNHSLSQHVFFPYLLTFFMGFYFSILSFPAFSPENSLLNCSMRLSCFRRASGLFLFHGSQSAAPPRLRNIAPENVDGRRQANHQPADDIVVVRRDVQQIDGVLNQSQQEHAKQNRSDLTLTTEQADA